MSFFAGKEEKDEKKPVKDAAGLKSHNYSLWCLFFLLKPPDKHPEMHDVITD